MRRKKKGTLKSGSGRTVKSRKQAIAIGLSEAREKGAKVPSRRAVIEETIAELFSGLHGSAVGGASHLQFRLSGDVSCVWGHCHWGS